ncbi:MAG TPA: IS21 family transposase [Gemmataceae bacterium]|nr:IS21 family transposase [Gemmataceae bacterium]
MANRLKMAKIDAILALHQCKWSIRRIAKELDIHRDTVARHIHEHALDSKQAGAPLGSCGAFAAEAQAMPAGADSDAPATKQAGAPLGSEASAHRQSSLCEPFRQVILDKLAAGLTAQRIYQDLVTDQGFAGKYHSVRRFVRRLVQSQPLPFRRMECAPGEEAQVDFGTGIPITRADGTRRRTHVFRIVLSHSRKGYSEVVHRQTTEEFIRCLENAFWHFGGTPKVLVLDNLKAGVEKADWYDPDLNPKLRSFAEHYGLALLPTRPRTPRHKGKIESGVGYVKKNALKGHVFGSLEEQNRHLLDWESNVADLRIHGTMRQQVSKVFAEVERPALQPLPGQRFAMFHEGQRIVNRDGHIEVERAYYSAPPEYLGRRVWVRWDGRLVRIFNQRFETIAVHVQREPGRFSTQDKHIVNEKISGVERGATWLLQRVRLIGPRATQWAEAMLQERGVEGVRVLQGLLSLTKRYRSEQIEHACELAHSYGAYRLRTLRQLIDRDLPKQQEFEFMDEHPLIRSLSFYQQFVHDAFQKGASS